jgi:23S rRNA-/tRNA-specific pseudouridylate synthase
MNDKARESLVEQVRSHAFLREYVAFVHGRPVRDRGTWSIISS